MGVKNINADEMQKLIDAGKAEIIDIREANEFGIFHLKGSKLIPMFELPDRLADIDWSKDVVLVCRSGGRSRLLAEELSAMGRDVYNLEHGILECYRNRGKHDIEQAHSTVENYFL